MRSVIEGDLGVSGLDNTAPRWFLVLLLVIALGLLAGRLVLVPRWLYPPLSTEDLRAVTDPRSRIELQQAQSRLTNDARAAMLQALAGLLAAIGTVATWHQVHTSREGQITERFTRSHGAMVILLAVVSCVGLGTFDCACRTASMRAGSSCARQ